MRREFHPTRNLAGTVVVPGDKSIAHRAALLSILSEGTIRIKNFPDNVDCRTSLQASQAVGVTVERVDGDLVLYPPEKPNVGDNAAIECGNSATTARLLAGLLAGSDLSATLVGDKSLSRRPMRRVTEPLVHMGADLSSDDGHLPLKINGKNLLPIDYDLPVASAQVKSALLLAGLASSCAVTIRENIITRDHTERVLESLGAGIGVREITPVMIPDSRDPRKKRMRMPESFKKEIILPAGSSITGGTVDIPGDISTAAFFMAAAALAKKTITVRDVGLNPTRTAILDYLRATGCAVEVSSRQLISGEPRGTVTVTGNVLRPRKISSETTVALIDEIPIIAIMAAFTEGTTVIRGADELRFKECDRLDAIATNLGLMGVKCGVLEDGLAIEGGKDLPGADFKSYGDHRMAMALSIAALFLVGPSTIDDASVVDISCPRFYDILQSITS
jgi:3-phosphoshikimate 1-carboxyvinyltransferase